MLACNPGGQSLELVLAGDVYQFNIWVDTGMKSTIYINTCFAIGLHLVPKHFSAVRDVLQGIFLKQG